MSKGKGAVTFAERKHEYKTNVDIILGNELKLRSYVLRTTLEDIGHWKAMHAGVEMSKRERRLKKESAVIDGEMWVFSVDGTKSEDIVASVKIAMEYFNVSASEFITSAYTKNLNADGFGDTVTPELIQANMKLYSGVCEALVQAGKELGVKGKIEFHVFSKNINPKITQDKLHDSLIAGGAASVVTDKNIYKVIVGHNSTKEHMKQYTNLHVATLKIK